MKSKENKILQKVVLPSSNDSQKGITPPSLLPMPKRPAPSAQRPANPPASQQPLKEQASEKSD